MRILAIISLVTLAAVACSGGDGGGDDDSDRAEPYVRLVARDIRSHEELPLGRRRADCVAAALVDAIGVDQLEDAGIDPRDFVRADSFDELGVELTSNATERLGRDLRDCDLRPILVDSFAGEVGDLSAGARECIADEIDDQALGAAVARAFITEEGASVANELLAGLVACPEALAEAFVAGIPAEDAEISADAAECVSDQVTERLPLPEGDAVDDVFDESVSACPVLLAELFVLGLEQEVGVDVSSAGAACITDQFRGRPEEAAEAFTEGGAASDLFGEMVVLACADVLGVEAPPNLGLRAMPI